MYCISINHRNAPAEVRNRFALTENGRRGLADSLRDVVSGCVILSTCNRTEVYFTGDDCGGKLSSVEGRLADAAQTSASEVRRYSMSFDDSSVFHLCKVACGMDSMVLGEVEIIRQIKDAYLASKEMGLADSEINLVFQGALACAKSAAAQGEAVRLPVSVGTLCAREAVRFCREKYAGGACAIGRILVVGATGKIGSIIVKDIADMAPDIELIGTSRSHGNRGGLFPADVHVRMCAYADRYVLAEQADVIISATASPHYTFTAADLMMQISDRNAKHVSEDRDRNQSDIHEADRSNRSATYKVAHCARGTRLFVDLAMPRDIDPAVADIPGCRLRDIDYINTLARENNESRRRSMRELEPFVRDRTEDIRKNILLSKFCRMHGGIMERVREDGSDRLVYEMRDKLGYEAFEEMLDGLLSIYDRTE